MSTHLRQKREENRGIVAIAGLYPGLATLSLTFIGIVAFSDVLEILIKLLLKFSNITPKMGLDFVCGIRRSMPAQALPSYFTDVKATVIAHIL